LKYQISIALFALFLFVNCSDIAVDYDAVDEELSEAELKNPKMSDPEAFCDCSNEMLLRVREIISVDDDPDYVNDLKQFLTKDMEATGCDLLLDEAKRKMGLIADQIEFKKGMPEEIVEQVYGRFECEAFKEYMEVMTEMVVKSSEFQDMKEPVQPTRPVKITKEVCDCHGSMMLIAKKLERIEKTGRTYKDIKEELDNWTRENECEEAYKLGQREIRRLTEISDVAGLSAEAAVEEITKDINCYGLASYYKIMLGYNFEQIKATNPAKYDSAFNRDLN